MSLKKGTALATILGLAAAGAAQAEMTLKFSHTYPANHYLVVNGIDVMIADIEEKTGGEITFEVYPAGQLGKNNVSNLNSGLADVAYVAPSVESTELALSTGVELPGAYSTACEGAAMASSLMEEGGIIDTEELNGKKLHFLYSTAFPEYALFSATREVASADDLVGLKVRAGGAAITKSFRALGAVPVSIPGGELFDALKRGTVDAAFFPQVAMHSYDLQEVVSYAFDNSGLGAGMGLVMASDRIWDQLTPEQQEIFTAAAKKAQDNFCNWIDDATVEAMDRMVAENGLEIIKLTDEQRADVAERIAAVREDWAAELESAGRPGNAVLDAIFAEPTN